MRRPKVIFYFTVRTNWLHAFYDATFCLPHRCWKSDEKVSSQSRVGGSNIYRFMRPVNIVYPISFFYCTIFEVNSEKKILSGSSVALDFYYVD